jgi:hypothetical protein
MKRKADSRVGSREKYKYLHRSMDHVIYCLIDMYKHTIDAGERHAYNHSRASGSER